MAERSAIVIGAGVAGLATAALLSREGYAVTVVERLGTIGGRAGEERIDGFRFETGPSWYLMPDAFDHFFSLFGMRTEDLLDVVDLTPAYRLFPEGRPPIDVESGREASTELFESLEPGAGAQLREYLDSASEAYGLAVDKFLYTTFSSPRPFFSRDLRGRYRDLARFLRVPLSRFVAERFTDVRLRQMLTYPAVFLSSHPAHTPSLYHLMSHTDLVQGVKYPRGGFSAVMGALRDLAEANGARILLNREVTAITYRGASATGVQCLGGPPLRADVVVSAADLRFTETRLLPPALRTYDAPWFASRDPGLGTVLLMLGVEGELPQLSHHNLLFSADWDADFDAVFDGPIPQRPLQASRSIYISKPSATEPGVAPAGCENLFVLVPTPAAEDLGHGNLYHRSASAAVEAIASATLELIECRCGIPDLRSRIRVQRTLGPADFSERYHAWSGGSIGPAHTLRQSAFLRGSNRSKKLRNLYYAGATTVPGVGVPMCLISAENVIKRLRGDRSSAPLKPGTA
ncbi:phytoene desaturase family protein [Corynebacterium auris]|uniref:phytoene desaturase family protein n=1 Tax=Corynebacterium auris TaxID=44750 RepID=UPI0025B30DD7|nr:phytoene desaturase family protein [Corynebacterium auris]WJY67700.1 Dehydrosqualene desaturase [Corynebacterium auris]